MASGGVRGPTNYQTYYHTDEAGDIWVDGKGNPIEITRQLTGHVAAKSPHELWNSIQTRNRTHPPSTAHHSTVLTPNNQKPLDTLPHSPISGNLTNHNLETENLFGGTDKLDNQRAITQTALTSMGNLISSCYVTIDQMERMQRHLRRTLDSFHNDDTESVTSDIVHDRDRQLKDKDIILTQKEIEIQELKDRLKDSANLTTNITKQIESLKHAYDQNSTQVNKTHQTQIRQLQDQIKSQRIYYENALARRPDLRIPPPPNHNQSYSDNSLVQSLNQSVSQQTWLNTQHYLNMAPSYDGKDPKQFYIWLDEVSRLATKYNMPHKQVAKMTSRGSVHRYITEMHSQNLDWQAVKIKPRERFSDCTSNAAAQNKLSSLKQNGKSIHEYIAEFSDLMEHAHNVKPIDPATKLLANQFTEDIDDCHKYTKNKLREKSGTHLDYYFQEAMRLQHKQETRAIDFGSERNTQVFECSDVNAIRANTGTCYYCKS